MVKHGRSDTQHHGYNAAVRGGAVPVAGDTNHRTRIGCVANGFNVTWPLPTANFTGCAPTGAAADTSLNHQRLVKFHSDMSWDLIGI